MCTGGNHPSPTIEVETRSTDRNDTEIRRCQEVMNNHTIIDEMFERGYLPYFYNSSYGGDGISIEADVFIRKIKRLLYSKDGSTSKINASKEDGEEGSSRDNKSHYYPRWPLDHRVMLSKERDMKVPSKYMNQQWVDPELVLSAIIQAKVFLSLGKRADISYSENNFEYVHMEYYHHAERHEYDGLEDVYFHESAYIADKVKEVIDASSIPAEEKIVKIQQLYEKVKNDVDNKRIIIYRQDDE